MRVLVIPSWYLSRQQPLLGIYVQEQCRLLQQQGIEVQVLYADLGLHHWRLDPRQQFKPFQAEENGIRTFRMQGILSPKRWQWSLYLWKQAYFQLFRYYFEEEGLPDIIHGHSYWGGVFAAQFKRKYNIPVVFTEHGSLFLESRRIPAMVRLAAREAALQADQRLCVGSALKQVLEDLTYIPFQVFPNAVDTQLFRLETHAGLKSGRSFRFVWVGGLIARKNPVLTLQAFSAFLQKTGIAAELVFVGDGPLAPELRQLIKQKGVEQQVSLVGPLALQEVAGLLQSAQALVVSSHAETFSVVTIEALASGIPVIATRCGGPEDILRADCGILIPPNDQEALVSAMIQLYDQYDHYNPARIREYAEINFGGTAVAQRLIAVYQEVLFKGRNPV